MNSPGIQLTFVSYRNSTKAILLYSKRIRISLHLEWLPSSTSQNGLSLEIKTVPASDRANRYDHSTSLLGWCSAHESCMRRFRFSIWWCDGPRKDSHVPFAVDGNWRLEENRCKATYECMMVATNTPIDVPLAEFVLSRTPASSNTTFLSSTVRNGRTSFSPTCNRM